MFDCVDSLTKDYGCVVTFVGMDNIVVHYQGTEFVLISIEELINFHKMLLRSILIDKND
jgi:hypothetical protein